MSIVMKREKRKIELRRAQSFQQEWECEFLAASYQPAYFRSICWAVGLCGSIEVLTSLNGHYDTVGGGRVWRILTYGLGLFTCMLNLVTAVAYSLPYVSIKRKCAKYYDLMCALILVFLNATYVVGSVVSEMRKVMFQVHVMEHISRSMNHSSFLPMRSCHDLDPDKTWIGGNMAVKSVGCTSTMLGGWAFGNIIMFGLLEPVFQMNAKSALVTSAINSVTLFAGLLVIGTRGGLIIASLLIYVASGLGSAYVCLILKSGAREHFTTMKHIQILSAQNSILLHAFIPKNVMSRLSALASGSSYEMLEASMDNVLVMFCALQPQELLKANMSETTLALLNSIFSHFDDAVDRFGMFKYQHVGDWYIVACPRAASPFDAAVQAAPSSAHVAGMLLLAAELRRIAAAHSLAGHGPLRLGVGIDCGPVAGVVIGEHRRFYCLYGDTVNVASRLCKHAGGAVHVSRALGREIGRAGLGWARPASRGVTEMKGVGAVETFDVSISAAEPEALEASKRFAAAAPPAQGDRAVGWEGLGAEDVSAENRTWLLDPGGRVSEVCERLGFQV